MDFHHRVLKTVYSKYFYFSQILGLEATLAGAASVIALLFDAVTDPLVGWMSDRFQTKNWGRRHPFMLASALPLALFMYLLFISPSGLDQMELFYWLTLFSILVRVALTFYLVPGMSLGAELTTDYDERTAVTSYRYMFSSFIGPLVILIGLFFFFTPTPETPKGLFNVAAYPKFALLCAGMVIFVIVVSVFGTKNVIPDLPQRSEADAKTNFK